MKTRLVLTGLNAGFLRLSLLAVLLAACAPKTSPLSAAPTATPLVDMPSPTPFSPADTQFATVTLLPNSSAVDAVPTEAPPATALPIATSRGPNLEATDPQTVSMASGGLQFVEFLEFW